MPADRYGDATDSVYAEVERLTALHRSKRPVYDDRFLSSPEITRSELAGAAAYDRAMRGGGLEDTGTRLSHAELDAGEDEVAAKYGRTKVNDMIHLAHAGAGLGRSENERHVVLSEVVLALRRGEKAVPAHKIAGLRGEVLRLSAASQDGTVTGPAEEEVRLAADHAGIFGLTVSAEQRRALARQGKALGPDGDFPVHDAHHLGLAKAAYKAGKLAGHSKSEVRAHINKNAKRLGLPGLDDDGDDDEKAEMTVALSAGPQERARQAARLGDSADAIAARHPQFFG
jgi:hypothetical protein